MALAGLLIVMLALGACRSTGRRGGAGAARSTSDPRVRSFLGRTPPAVAGGEWLKPAADPAAVRVSFVQFTFPT